MKCLKDIGIGLLVAGCAFAAVATIAGLLTGLEHLWKLWLTSKDAIVFATIGSFFVIFGAVGGAANCYFRGHK